MELFEVRALFTKFLEEFADDYVMAFLVGLLVQLVPNCWKPVVAVPSKATKSEQVTDNIFWELLCCTGLGSIQLISMSIKDWAILNDWCCPICAILHAYS